MILRAPTLASLACVLFALGCGDDTTNPGGGGSGAGGSGGSGGSEETCEDKGGTCYPIPAGFQGPIELSDSGATQCTNEAFEGTYAGEPYVAEAAECNCACSVDAACALDVEVHTDTACQDGATPLPVTSGNCIAAPPSVVSASVSATAGACQSDGAPPFVPSIKFDPQVVGCNVNLDPCEDGVVCVPSTRKYCYYSDTATECPEGFVEQLNVVRRDDFDDDRTCACQCGSEGISCDPSIALHSAAACMADDTTDAGAGCFTTTSGNEALSLVVDAGAAGECSLTATSTGGVTQASAGVLVCCAL